MARRRLALVLGDCVSSLGGAVMVRDGALT